KKWLDERRKFIDKHKDHLYKETIIAYESQKLPVVYTDGSYLPNKNQYSSSVVICEEWGSIATFAKSNKKNRNNIVGELEALLYALKLVVGLYDFKEFIVVYDFDQLEQVARNVLKIKGVQLALQNEIVQLIDENKLGIHFLNVKSHTGVVGNSVADAIAKDINKHLGQFDLLRDLTFLTSI
ncbi:ribonuclease HI, partial [Enterococcus faecalis 13-SD-W-01]